MSHMKCISKASQLLHALHDGPATTGELAAELGWSVHLTNAHASNLHLRGRVNKAPFPTGDKRVRYLWSIKEEKAA